MICPHCKNEIPDATRFCPNCGKEISQQPPIISGGLDKWQKNLALIGALLGFGSGLIALIGWFSPWTSFGFGNGPQLIILPFGLGAGAGLLQNYPALTTIIQSVNQITGWFLLISIVLAIISIVLALMSLLSIWVGVKCLELRSDLSMLPNVKAQINKIGSYGLTGIILVIIVMVVASVFQVGKSVIGGGAVAMAIGFIAAFVMVIYLKPHLR